MNIKLLFIIIFLILTIISFFNDVKFKKEDREYEELSEKDKFYRSLRHLIYILIAIILIPIGIKLLLLYGLLSL